MTKDYDTYVFDDIDKLEKMCERYILEKNGKQNLSSGFSWGEGWEKFGSELVRVFSEPYNRGKNVILVGHADIKKVSNPEGDDYDCYVLQASKKFKQVFDGWYEFIFFMRHDLIVNKEDGKAIGFSKGEASIYTRPRTGFIAKNRYDMPPKVSTNFKSFEEFVSVSCLSNSQIYDELSDENKAKITFKITDKLSLDEKTILATTLVAQRLKN